MVRRKVKFYNLDAIISVGYRVNSTRGIQFRQWATKRLKDYLVQGYAINEKRLAQKQQEIQTLKDGIRILSRVIEQKAEGQNLEWLNHFAKGLELLDDYDHENLDKKGLTKRPANYPSFLDKAIYLVFIHFLEYFHFEVSEDLACFSSIWVFNRHRLSSYCHGSFTLAPFSSV